MSNYSGKVKLPTTLENISCLRQLRRQSKAIQMHFQPLNNGVKSVLGIKESYSLFNREKVLKFSQIVSVRLEEGDPPPLTHT